jgi:transglutaminase-like putative cysteine protease
MSVFKIHHITKYHYEQPIVESVNEIRIFPYQSADQEVLQHDLIITSQPNVHVFKDYWGNKVGFFNILEPHQELIIESKLTVRTIVDLSGLEASTTGFDILNKEVEAHFYLLELTKPDVIESQEQVQKILESFFNRDQSIKEVIEKSSQYIFENFTYTKGITNIETTIDEILVHKKGVCQDFAHLLLQILRTMHIPCRYVSGYICPNKNGMRGEGATHAWVDAWVPGIGWCGIDPTNNAWVNNHHVKLAVGRNFYDSSVVKGTYKGSARQDLFVFVSVGYEDGHIFEETNQVLLDKQELARTTSIKKTSMAIQQQQ